MTLAPAATHYAPRGMVCAIDHLAAEAGVAMLQNGGSAADAAVATSAVLAVTCQHMCGMGGDLWAIVHPGPGQAVTALNASGRAGSLADPDRLRAAGHRAIPGFGHPAAVPVPGCVDGWTALHARYGRLPLEDVLEPARLYAAEGFPASPTLAAAADQIAHLPGADDYTAVGGPLRPGQVVRRPGVARALAAVAGGGRDAHYGGEFGRGLLEVCASELSEADLARSQADWVAPLRAEAWNHQLWTVPPNSQGYLTLAGAWIADGLALPEDPDDPLWAHLLVEASRWAGYDRLEVLHEGAGGASLLDPARLGPRRQAIGPRAAELGEPLVTGGDTVALCAVDRDRQGVTLVQSNASGWGCGLVVPGVRIFLHNRGAGFSLEPGHPAEYRAGRRPPHTLSPALATDRTGERLRLVLGTMGGDSQPQILLQLLARVLHGGQEPGDAVAAGRFALGPGGANGEATPASAPPGFDTWTRRGRVTVEVEGQAPPAWVPGLRERGHDVVMEPAFQSSFGHAHLIAVGPDGLAGGRDPRPRSGAAVGY